MQQVEPEGAFRTLDKQAQFNRTCKMHLVDKVEGGLVIGTKGNTYPTKQTYAAPNGTLPSSNNGEEDAFTSEGSARTEDKR